MNVLRIFSRDIYVETELSLNDLKKIKTALGRATLIPNEGEEKEKEACDYLIEVFEPKINSLIEEIEDGIRSNS